VDFGANGCFNISLDIVHSLRYVLYIRDVSETFGFILDVKNGFYIISLF
jgi:hypothetical protein